ncbi:MAG: shikimate dehydrogenase [Alistipes sp.]|nr:shikimate dehydrogenase [Alistipes sp.]
MKHYALIGRPLGHSASAAYFSAKFAAEAIDADYSLCELADIAEVESLRGRLSGMNVTIPYKKAIIPYLASISEEARGVGAVNCVKFDSEGAMHGYNTDVEGIRATLSRFGDLRGRRALVLGSGGAAAAVLYVLRECGVECCTVSRSAERGDVTYEQITPATLQEYHIIVNATPTGMYPHTDEAPQLPYEALGEEHILFDLIYNPDPTEFLLRGAAQGAKTVGGSEMFRCQAEASWRIWNRM